MNWNIRLAREEDTPAMLAIYSPFVTETAVSFEEAVPTEAEFWKRVQAVLPEAPWLVCTQKGQVCGFAYAGRHRQREAYRYTRELSAYVHPGFLRRKVGTALYTTLVELLRQQGYANTLAGITLPNPASVRFHEHFGFRKVGEYKNVGFKFGKFHTVGWWEMAISSKIDGRLATPSALTAAVWDLAVAKGLGRIR